ncbi:MAG: hypothetical protein KBD04_06730 [Proteobacteria bacterium]|nr:hypothetical protein [Pseudomonadota bacterium]
MKKIQKLLALAVLTSTTAFASVVEVNFADGATWNSAITGGAKLVGSAATAVLNIGANSTVTENLELSAGRANLGKSGVVDATNNKYIELAANTQLNVTAAITPDPIKMTGAATINNAANAITLDKLTGAELATLTGAGVVTLADLSGNSGGVAGVNVAINGSTKFPAANSSFSGIATVSAAPAAAASDNLTFNQITASYNVGANDFIASGSTKVLKASKLVLGGNTWAAAVTAN